MEYNIPEPRMTQQLLFLENPTDVACQSSDTSVWLRRPASDEKDISMRDIYADLRHARQASLSYYATVACLFPVALVRTFASGTSNAAVPLAV